MVSCPDPSDEIYEPGSVQYLEKELLRAKQAVIAAKDAEYLTSPRFIEHVNKLVDVCHRTVYGKSGPETIEEKVLASIKGAGETAAKYTDSLWAKRPGQVC